MNIPSDLKYTKTHEWVRAEGEKVFVGITDYAQEALGDIVYVEIPQVNEELAKSDEAATIESVKAASAIYAPCTGVVKEANEALEETPELINQKPYETFIFSLSLNDPADLEDLLDAAAYAQLVEQEKENH
jgi:glycine cleavage system H protein